MLEYYFNGCDYAKDFEALVDAHKFFDWLPESEYDVWFKAYDTSCHENEREIELDKQGYKYDCYVTISEFGTGGGKEVLHKPAKTKEEAEEMLESFACWVKGKEKEIKRLYSMYRLFG